MLRNLHVKNLALIDEAEVDFEKGLNILTGETGAGKSIIIGSINLALGEKVSKEMLRDNGENAFVELIFDVESDSLKEALSGLDVYPEDDMLILSRKISGGRSIAKINGESVPAGKKLCGDFSDECGRSVAGSRTKVQKDSVPLERKTEKSL